MKILSNFNTKLDEEKLQYYINKYWEWEIVLIKRSPIFLLSVLFLILILLIIFIFLLYVVYYQYHNELYKYLFMFFYILWLWIYLILTISLVFWYLFWKKHENIKTTIKNDDFENWHYEHFLKWSLFLIFFQILLLILWLFFIYIDWKEIDIYKIWLFILQLILNLGFLYLMFKIFKIIVDFENDFTIVNADKIEFTNQNWIFTRSTHSIDREKIKTISVNKKWILGSLFNVWSLTIFTEWDEKNWEINLKYLENPEKVHKVIESIVREWE